MRAPGEHLQGEMAVRPDQTREHGRQLDRERQPIETYADFRDSFRVLLVNDEIALDRFRSFFEE